jgi:hypothetical protein
MPYEEGEYETLNEVYGGKRNKDSAAHLDNFLLEADETGVLNTEEEKRILESAEGPVDAEKLYARRLDLQFSVMKEYFEQGIVWRVVYSGMKSVHGIVRVDPPPENLKERRWLFAYLCKRLGGTRLTFDSQVGDPTRLTRAPVNFKRSKQVDGVTVNGLQRLICVDESKVYRLNWRPLYEAWEKREKTLFKERGASKLPTKAIYQEAAKAFMDETYFTDRKWDGQRQETFFPLYRIVRSLNYSEDEFWEMLDGQVAHYYKPDEIVYWRTRRECKVIRDIEDEFSQTEGYK